MTMTEKRGEKKRKLRRILGMIWFGFMAERRSSSKYRQVRGGGGAAG